VLLFWVFFSLFILFSDNKKLLKWSLDGKSLGEMSIHNPKTNDTPMITSMQFLSSKIHSDVCAFGTEDGNE
jgi:hypothetical protein